MNKGRSRVFSERMKGVFKSRSRGTHSKIPETPKSGTESEVGKGPDCNKNIPDFCSPIINGSLCQSQSMLSGSYSANMNGNSSCIRNEKVEVTPDEKSYKVINDYISGPRNGERGGLSSHNELHIKTDVINKSCQSCPPNLDINQNSSQVMNSRVRLSQKTTAGEGTIGATDNNNANNNNNYYSSLRSPKSYRCGVGMCHICLKQICVCGNGNKIYNNDNYFDSPEGPFRFSQVLQNAFGEEKTNRNEFIILALGIQHYIKEVFHALDYNNNGFVYHEDLQILCKILGKDLDYESDSDISYSWCEMDNNEDQICANNSCKTHLHFGKFSEILCNKFSKLSDKNILETRKNTQLINAVVNISRRSESLGVLSKQLEELEKDYVEFKNKSKYFTLPNINNAVNNCSSCTKYQLMEGKNKANNIYLENMKLQKIILLQQQELQCLREVIEDLRISLQCSDAENLSLRVREVKSHKSSMSDDQISKVFTLSTDDDKDSIDRIIQNFPSSEDLHLSSNESLLTIRSLQSRPPSRSVNQTKSNQSDIDTRSNLLSQKILERMGDDDLGLNKEIQLVYQELSNTRSELEDTRTDLENTVSEIQTKNDQINRLTKNLNEVKGNFDNSVEENSNLKEKIILLKNIEKNKDLQIEILEKQIFEIKSQLVVADQQTKLLDNELQTLKIKRKRDLQQLSRTRNLIAKSLVEVNRSENLLKSPSMNKNFPANSVAILEKDSRIFDTKKVVTFADCDNNNNDKRTVNPNTVNMGSYDRNKNGLVYNNNNNNYNNYNNNNNNKTISYIDVNSNNAHKSHNFCQNHNSDNYKKLSSNYNHISDENYQTKEQSRLNLSPCESRRTDFNFNDSFPLVAKEEKNVDHINDFNKEERGEVPLTIVSSPKSKTRSLGTGITEEKPTLEVKPNLIRPIGIMKPILKNPLSSPFTLRSTSTEDLKSTKPQIEPFLSLELNQKILPQDGTQTAVDAVEESISTSECKIQSKTSTQILEGLEAEVEYLLSML